MLNRSGWLDDLSKLACLKLFGDSVLNVQTVFVLLGSEIKFRHITEMIRFYILNRKHINI